MELVRPKRRSPIPARQRTDLPLDAVGIPDATDVGTRHWCPLPRHARAAEAHPEVGPRPRAKAARRGPAGDTPSDGDGPSRPARVMRPAGGLSAPKAHPGPDGSGILPSARPPHPP